MTPPSLDPDAAAYLERLRALGAPPPGTLTPQQLREGYDAGAAAVAGPGLPVADVRDEVADGVRVRRYSPEGARGTVVYLHGGGWVVGTLDAYEHVCRALAVAAGASVVSVDYDLSPEARHPVAVEQGLRVLRWAHEQSGAGPLAVAGDSAGGHLAGLVAARAEVPLAAAALVYPVVSPGLDTPSARDNATGFALETSGMRWYWQQYLPHARTDVPVDLLQTDLARFPPSLVLTAGFDPLRDEGLALASALEAAGVPVERLPYDGQVHGFFRATALIRQSSEAHQRVGAFLGRHLA